MPLTLIDFTDRSNAREFNSSMENPLGVKGVILPYKAIIQKGSKLHMGISISLPLIVTHGVPQCSILGPMLFRLCINDLPDAIRTCSVESYVVDTKLFLSFATNDNVNALSQIGQYLNRVAV